MASTQQYFQFLKEAHPTGETTERAFDRLPDEQRAAINALRREFPKIGKDRYGVETRQIGPVGFLELLCRLAAAKRAYEIGEKIDLSNKDVVRKIANSI